MEKIVGMVERCIFKWQDNPWLLKYLLVIYFFARGQKRAAEAVEFTISLVSDMNGKYLWAAKKAVVAGLISAKIEKLPQLYWSAPSAQAFVILLLQATRVRSEYNEHLWFFTECALRCAVAARDASLLPDVLVLLGALNDGRMSPCPEMDLFDATVAQPGMLIMATSVLQKIAAEKSPKN